jgi:hypothetical protein
LLAALVLFLFTVLGGLPESASAQKSVAELLGRPPASEGEAKSYLEEVVVFSYIEKAHARTLLRRDRYRPKYGRAGRIEFRGCATKFDWAR